MPGRILVVDDDESMCQMIEADLSLRGHEVSWYTSAEQALGAMRECDFDVVLTDLNMPRVDGIELCRRIMTNRPDVPVVVITAFGSLETAVEAIRAGAHDFVTKPVELDILDLTLERAIEHRALREQVKVLRESSNASLRFRGLIGESPPMLQLYDLLSRIADVQTTALITGETGTGKEVIARSLNEAGHRRKGPFVPINCAGLPETLIESELFGYVQGAFTGARKSRKGLLLEADGGTLFLDEVGEIPLALQPKFLRALERGLVRPVGSDKEFEVDVRIIAATNRDLETAVEEGQFREDLYFRLNVIPIQVPPLRARGTDILLLAQHFLEQAASKFGNNVKGISAGAAKILHHYSWPGNVRELRNAIESAVAMTRFEDIVVEDLPERVRAYKSSHIYIGGSDPSEIVPMDEIERRYIVHALRTVSGNKTNAARLLGFDRKTLYRKIERYRISSAELS